VMRIISQIALLGLEDPLRPGDPRVHIPSVSIVQLRKRELDILGLLCLVAWVNALNMVRFLQTFGLLLIIIRKMVSDLLRFLGLFVVIVIGLAVAFHLSMGQDLYRFRTIGDSLMGVMLMVFGDFLADNTFRANRVLGAGLMLVVMIVLTVVLLNLLIAMLNDSYQRVQDVAETEWKLEQARIISITLDNYRDDGKGVFALYPRFEDMSRAKYRCSGFEVFLWFFFFFFFFFFVCVFFLAGFGLGGFGVLRISSSNSRFLGCEVWVSSFCHI
jgi:hypothetical protein